MPMSSLISAMIAAAHAAGEGLIADRQRIATLTVHSKAGAADMFTEADLKAEATVRERLMAHAPGYGFLGEEAGGALFAGAKYGQGTLYTRNMGNYPVYWQGPSIGFDIGGDGSKVMILVYSLPNIQTVYERYPGVNGSAYVVGGLGMTVMKRKDVVMVPIRSGVGARLGINVGYLKFTQEPTWNPF